MDATWTFHLIVWLPIWSVAVTPPKAVIAAPFQLHLPHSWDVVWYSTAWGIPILVFLVITHFHCTVDGPYPKQGLINWSQLNNSKLQQTVTAVDTKSIWNKKYAIKFQITVKYITFEINLYYYWKYLLYLQVHVLWNTLYLRSQNTTVANIINSHLLTLQLKILSINTTVHKLQCWVTVLLG